MDGLAWGCLPTVMEVGEANSTDPHRQVDICAVEPTGLTPPYWMDVAVDVHGSAGTPNFL